MEVKIYREKENEPLVMNEDSIKEFYSLVDELGLKNQGHPDKQSVPKLYVRLNKPMQNALTAICPVHCDVEVYHQSTIPNEVLKVLKFCKDQNMFDKYQIWYADKQPDPLLIGMSFVTESDRTQNYTWNANWYLIARWGDCALELEQLIEKGFKTIKISLIDFAVDAKSQIQSILDHPDTYVRKAMNGDSVQFNYRIGSGNDFLLI